MADLSQAAAVNMGPEVFMPAPLAASIKPKSAEWVQQQFYQMPNLCPPAGRARRVVVTGFSRFGFWAKAKVYQWDYFAAFSRRLAQAGVDCFFVWDEDGLERHVTGKNTAILHMFNEEKPWSYTARIRDAERKASFIACTVRGASIIQHKKLTNIYLTAHGVPMPKQIHQPSETETVFSNSVIGSGKRVNVVAGTAALDQERYNTEFVDTRFDYAGKSYYTMFRIQAIGRRVLHSYVRARDVSENAPSVHSANTPADAGLLNHLYDVLIAPRKDEIAQFTAHLGALLGPGFYAHDMVVCNKTGQMKMVEAGVKFNDSPYAEYLESERHMTPNNAMFYDGSYPVRSAELFLEEWDVAMTTPQPDSSMVLNRDVLMNMVAQ